MYPSLESMLCFFWLFLFLFYTQCMYYLCFLGVHWFKRICYKRCYKRIYYPVYGSLSTINHGNILTDHTWSVMFVLYKTRKKEKRVSLSPPLWTWLCIRCNLCYISSFFFNDTNMSMVVRKKKTLWGKFICLLKNCSRTNELSNILPEEVQRELLCCTLRGCRYLTVFFSGTTSRICVSFPYELHSFS